MKIRYDPSGDGKLAATVWQNDELHTLTPGQQIDLDVKRGDKLTFKVGKISAVHPINYQSLDAKFVIKPNRYLQTIYFICLFVLVFVLWYFKTINNTWLTVIIIAAIVAFEVMNYAKGWQVEPVHEGVK